MGKNNKVKTSYCANESDMTPTSNHVHKTSIDDTSSGPFPPNNIDTLKPSSKEDRQRKKRGTQGGENNSVSDYRLYNSWSTHAQH